MRAAQGRYTFAGEEIAYSDDKQKQVLKTTTLVTQKFSKRAVKWTAW